MNKFLLQVLFFAFLLNTAFGQDNGIHQDKNSKWSDLRFNGPVKSSRCISVAFNGRLKEDPTLLSLGSDIRSSLRNVEFNSAGLLLRGRPFAWRNLDSPTDNNIWEQEYQYNKSDIAKKITIKPIIKHSYPVCDYMLLFWIDKSRPSKSPGEDDEIDYSHYSYRHEGTKVRKAIAYFVWNDSVNVEKAENIQNEITFNYDKLGRVIRQDITVGKAGEDMPLTIFGTQTGYCEDTHIDYAYDTKNRITKIVLMSCEKVVFEERYFYATDKDYVASVFTFSPGFNSKFKSTWTTYYNEHGDITSCFLSTSPEDPHKVPPLGITGYGFTHRYYDYEYDSYGNWIKCRFFLEGTHEGEPSAIVERKIEYYKE